MSCWKSFTSCLRNDTSFRIALLILCFITISSSTIIRSFSAFVNAIKAQFQLTQTEVSIIACMNMVMGGLMLPGGIVYDKWGVLPTLFLSLTITTLGWSGMWISTIIPHTNQASYYIILISIGLAAHGRSYTEILTLPYGMALVKQKFRTVTILFLEIAIDVGNFIFSIVYEHMFTQSDGEEVKPKDQKLATYFIICLIVSFVVNVANTIVFPLGQQYRISESEDEANENSATEGNTVPAKKISSESLAEESLLLKSKEDKEINDSTVKKKEPIYTDIVTLTYICLIISLIFGKCTTNFYYTNVTLVSQPLLHAKYDYYLVILQRPTIILGKFIMTGIFMATKKLKFSIEVIILINNLLVTTTQILFLFYGQNDVVFLVVIGAIYLCHATYRITQTNAMASMFPLERFGINYGLLTAVTPFVTLALQLSFGQIYDNERANKDDIYCYGKHCLYIYFIVECAIAGFASFMAMCLLVLRIRKNRRVAQNT